jgi:probable O-glycosylation ligase (exosortase A-associated)
VHDLAFLGFLAMLLGMGFRRPFLFVLTYVYIDIVAPQRLTYFLLNTIPISLIAVILAVGSWAVVDSKNDTKFTVRQGLMVLLLVYCGVTTTIADFPLPAAAKWGWVWKSIAFGIFLPLTLRSKLRIEALALFVTLSASAIIIVGGIKTLASGGGYGILNLMVTNNQGLYESSSIAMASICLIPLILYLGKHSTIFPRDWKVKLFTYSLVFACLLIPVGTQARTGLICIAVLALLTLRSTKRRFLYLFLLGLSPVLVYPMLPKAFKTRMATITNYQGDKSASTRVAVWKWTIDYASKHPGGGGFDAFRGNRLRFETVSSQEAGGQTDVSAKTVEDVARAYHSSYFEMLGEQGYPGLIIWLLIHLIGLYRMQVVRAFFRKRVGADDQWIGLMAEALQHGHFIYLAGALFVGVAYMPFMFLLMGLQIGLDTYSNRIVVAEKRAHPTYSLRFQRRR